MSPEKQNCKVRCQLDVDSRIIYMCFQTICTWLNSSSYIPAPEHSLLIPSLQLSEYHEYLPSCWTPHAIITVI